MKSLRFVSLFMVSLLGCGDSDGGGSSSGVDGSKLLTALTDADAQALCRFEREQYKAHLPGETAYCTYFANDTQSAEQCEEWRDQCIQADDYENEVDDDWECDSATAASLFDDEAQSCEGTVQEYEACVRAQTAARGAELERATCDNAPVDEDDEDEVAEACKTLLEKCPALD